MGIGSHHSNASALGEKIDDNVNLGVAFGRRENMVEGHVEVRRGTTFEPHESQYLGTPLIVPTKKYNGDIAFGRKVTQSENEDELSLGSARGSDRSRSWRNAFSNAGQ